MNNESGSALQKASFALLVFIAAALAYLIVRDRVRDREEQRATAEAAEAAQNASASASTPLPAKSSFAPLRPRGEPNVARTTVNPPRPVPVGSPP